MHVLSRSFEYQRGKLVQQPSTTQRPPWLLSFVISGALLAAVIIMTLFAVNARAIAPQRTITQAVTTPHFTAQSSKIKANRQGIIVFSPSQLTVYAQVQNFSITNTTGQTIELYFNGTPDFTMPPGDMVNGGFTNQGVGTNTFTIPMTNPNAQLTILVKPFSTPNSDLKVNAYGKVVFSPKMLSCSVYQGACITITNTTAQKMKVYLHGVFYTALYPNQVYNVGLSGPGTYIFTIPSTDSNAKLTVIGQ